MSKKTSKISGFYKLQIKKRIEIVKNFSDLSEEETKLFSSCLDIQTADRMIENVLGTFELPLGIAVNFVINEKEYLIPMVTEESSVVAAASNAAKIACVKGGFKTECSEPLMIGQLQLIKVEDAADATEKILKHKKQLLDLANDQDNVLV